MLRVLIRHPSLVLTLAFLLMPLEANVPQQMYVLAPPTTEDIVRSMGPDAQGLQILPDSLPDIFTLTAGRIDEDPKKFIVVQPYIAGRWVGGRAVIEYARDLSYTLVSVYDKKGKRQRIYSVTRRPASNLVAVPRSEPAVAAVVVTPPAEPETERAPASPSVLPSAELDEESLEEVSVSLKKSTPKTTGPTKSTAKAGPGGFEWDDAAGAYVQPGGKKQPSKKAPKPSRKSVSPVPSNPIATIAAPATSVPAAPVLVTPVPVVASVPKPSVAPKPAAASSVPASPLRTVPSPPASVRSAVEAVASKEQVVDAEVPSTEELLGIEKVTTVQRVEPAKAVVEPVVLPTKRPEPTQMPAAAAASQYVWDDEEGAYVPKKSGGAKKTVSAPVSAPVDVPVPVTVAIPKSSSKEWVPEPRSKAVTPEVSEPPAPPPFEEQVPSSRKRKKVSQDVEMVRESAAVAVAQVPIQEPVVDPMTDAGPDTNPADAWTPKETPKPRVVDSADDPALKAAVKVASVPRPAPAAQPSIDDLLKAAAESKKSVPSESEGWVPRSSARKATSEAEIAAELARVQKREALKEKEAAAPKVTIKQDVNNPEEGVLPIHAFEKFSGARYGRHREYERRVFWGKRAKAPIQNYDFYVDEVDRKKETHTVYYYQKGKVPKLVAQERYTNAKFLSNYDVDLSKHGTPKVTKY